LTRTLPPSSALLGAFAVAAACSYDFDQYLAPAEVNTGGSAGATTLSGGSSPGGGNGANGGIRAGGGAAGDGGSTANSEGGEAASTGGTMGGGAPPTEGGAPSDAGASGENAGGTVGGSPSASGGSSNGGTAGTAGNSGASGGDGGAGGFAFDCAEASGTVFAGHCYFLIGDGDGLEWNDAKTACANLTTGSHLVTITSEAEEQFVEATFFPDTTDRWIGLAVADTTRDPPVSCRRTPATCPFSWVTGESLSYTKWDAYGVDVEPNYTGGCVRIEADSSDWADFDCDEQLPAICEID
jgi:hypothetical protein